MVETLVSDSLYVEQVEVLTMEQVELRQVLRRRGQEQGLVYVVLGRGSIEGVQEVDWNVMGLAEVAPLLVHNLEEGGQCHTLEVARTNYSKKAHFWLGE